MSIHHEIVGTTAVPNWMIRLAVWVVGGLGSGCAVTVSVVVWWVFGAERRIAHLEVKRDDVISMLNSMSNRLGGIGTEVHHIERKVDVIEARMAKKE